MLCVEPKEHKRFRPGTRPGGLGFPAGRIGDRGDREIVYVPNVYVPFPAAITDLLQGGPGSVPFRAQNGSSSPGFRFGWFFWGKGFPAFEYSLSWEKKTININNFSGLPPAQVGVRFVYVSPFA